MNVNEFIRKLFKGGIGSAKMSINKPYHIEMDIDDKLLQDNMDLLARELHMEVEEKAKYIRKIKHAKIYLADATALITKS